MTIPRKVFDFFRSRALALTLMLTLLLVCFIATTFLSGELAQRAVFTSLWFNALLVLLVLNVACCFFSRIQRRGWNLISTGMIIFHLSFVAIFAGTIVSSLFHYGGALRLTEGETIGLGDPNAYDKEWWGRFFNHKWMRGDVTFHKHLINYGVDGKNKGIAHEISIVDGAQEVRGVIYPTHSLKFNGFKFYFNTDGFAPLFVLYDRNGRELYGAYVPMQSFELVNDTILYTTGTKEGGPGGMDFPQIPGMPPLFRIQFTYDLPKSTKDIHNASFKIWEYNKEDHNGLRRLVFEGTAPMGGKVTFGDYALSMQEIRYWASMDVLYDPGLPVVLTSLWICFGGILLTTVARLVRKK